VRDIAVLERAYRTVVAAKPTMIAPVYFSLEPDNATKTRVQVEAAKDALRRARLSVEASGGGCQTQVFAGWPSYVGGSLPTDVARPNNLREVASPMMAMAPPPPAPAPQSLDQAAEAMQVTLQTPMERLQASTCVVYALLP
jgi:hypothetical protein